MFNFLEIQTHRSLSEQDVLRVNCVIKRRAHRYIAAAREEWLYPERHVKFNWGAVGGEHLFMSDPRSLQPGAEMVVGYAGGRTEAMDLRCRLTISISTAGPERSSAAYEAVCSMLRRNLATASPISSLRFRRRERAA